MNEPTTNTFSSRDRWPIWLWLFCLFLAASLAIAVEAALGKNLGWATLIAENFLLIWAALSTPLLIEVSEKELSVGSARIDRGFITAITPLNSREMALIRGRDANPLCWMALRFWVSTGVKIEIADPRDPTPYWLVSTKRAVALATALNQKL